MRNLRLKNRGGRGLVHILLASFFTSPDFKTVTPLSASEKSMSYRLRLKERKQALVSSKQALQVEVSSKQAETESLKSTISELEASVFQLSQANAALRTDQKDRQQQILLLEKQVKEMGRSLEVLPLDINKREQELRKNLQAFAEKKSQLFRQRRVLKQTSREVDSLHDRIADLEDVISLHNQHLTDLDYVDEGEQDLGPMSRFFNIC